MRKLTDTEQATLDLAMAQARVAGEAIKAEWRRQRERDLEALGLPPRRGEREGEE